MNLFANAAAGAVLALSAVSLAPAAEAQSTPRGSYNQSCQDAYVRGGTLYAQCLNLRGEYRASSISVDGCRDRNIGNDNGLLTCGDRRGQWESGRPGNGGNNGGGNNGGGWGNGGGNNGGGWGNGGGNRPERGSVEVFRDSEFRGASRVFDGEVADLGRSGFNDAISSMRFRGTWLACTDSYFRGNCQTFENNVRNLDRWGLNDRISSLRPVRRNDRY